MYRFWQIHVTTLTKQNSKRRGSQWLDQNALVLLHFFLLPPEQHFVWPQMMTAILGPSSHHLCSHLSLSFANLGVNFQLLGCHSLILTIKMIASYMYQNVGVRGVKRHIILSDRNPLNTTVFNGSMEDNNPSDEVLPTLQISMVGWHWVRRSYEYWPFSAFLGANLGEV